MNGKQAKRLRAAARLFLRSVPLEQHVTGMQQRLSKREIVEMPTGGLGADGAPVIQRYELKKFVLFWPVGNLRRATQNIKRAFRRGRVTTQRPS